LDDDSHNSRHPAILYFGNDDMNIGNTRDECDNSKCNGGETTNTIFLPPTTMEQLTSYDVTLFYLQYLAITKLSCPKLAYYFQRIHAFMMDAHEAVSPLSVGFLTVLLLPSLIARIIQLYQDDRTFQSLSIHQLKLHTSDLLTLLSFIIGTNAIARFLLSEYKAVKQKADSMQLSRSFTAAEMLEYRVDYYFSTSKWAKVAFLLSLTFILIAVGAGLLAVFLEDHSLSNAAWMSWTFVADPGTHADAPEGLLIRFVSFGITVGGMIIFALMIGIISDSIGDKVDDLKKGKSRIIESGHSVILGWNDKSLAIIQQIALANESEGGGTVVVLADQEKEELEEMLNAAVASKENPLRLLGTEVIIRSGNPLLESELRKISVNSARSVISLSKTDDDMDPDEADANQVRQVMALKTFEGFENACHVVVELQDVDNRDLVGLVAPDFAEVIVTNDLIGRLMIQCARCPGLAAVLEEMMGFEGSEFYIEEWPELVGKTFYQITCRFDDAIPLGIRHFDGSVSINPENDYEILEGDKILVLAEDNDSYEVNDDSYVPHAYATECISKIVACEKKTEKILFCGWRRDMADMISQLDEYVEKGSELWLFNLVPAAERAELLKDKGNKDQLTLKNLTIFNVVGNPIIRRDLSGMRAVDVNGAFTGETVTLCQFDSILILADAVAIERGANMMSCDSRSLSSLLIIQDVMTKQYEAQKTIDPNTKPPCLPVSEILDTRTKSLLKVVEGKMGYIMSNQIISAVMAQVSEEKDINVVLREILTAEGSETFIRPISRFVDLSKESNLSFWDVALRARQRREVAIGYKPQDMDFKEAAHLVINPPDKGVVRKWSRGDVVVTFALD
jgi:Trk K+ transport system NAD-binding subunit